MFLDLVLFQILKTISEITLDKSVKLHCETFILEIDAFCGFEIVGSVDLCELKSDPGPCKWFSTMFYYDSSLHSCETFSFGGCGGNRNRFSTVEKCLENCAVGNRIHSQSTSVNQSSGEVHFVKAVSPDNYIRDFLAH